MKQLLKDAQRILDDCGENHLHPANNRRHPLHQQALMAITELEKKKSWCLPIRIGHFKRVKK